MRSAITWRSKGTRSDGRECTVVEITEFEQAGWATATPRGSYVLVDHEPTARLEKGRYQVLPGNDVVICDDPDAP